MSDALDYEKYPDYKKDTYLIVQSYIDKNG